MICVLPDKVFLALYQFKVLLSFLSRADSISCRHENSDRHAINVAQINQVCLSLACYPQLKALRLLEAICETELGRVKLTHD